MYRLRLPKLLPGRVPAAAPEKSGAVPRVRGGAEPDRLRFLDSARGIAVTAVVLLHIVLTAGPRSYLSWAGLPVLRLGGFGVTLFFVISAFTLCYMWAARRGEPQATGRFYVRRVFRIVPLYYAWLILMAVLRDRLAGHAGELASYAAFTFNFVPGQVTGLVLASWTLGVEMPFYLLFPLLPGYVTNVRRAAGFLVLTLLMASTHLQLTNAYITDPQTAFVYSALSFFRHLPAFATGMVVYYAWLALPRHPARALAVSLFVAQSGIFGLICAYQPASSWNNVLVAPACGAIVLGLAAWPARLFVNRVTAAVGTLSYSLYLNHPLIVEKLGPVYAQIYDRPWHPAGALAACTLVTVVPVAVVSLCTYVLIERPGMAVGRRLARLIR